MVETSSANLWWGIYGFCTKTGWEDLYISDDKGNRLGQFCLSAKAHLRNGVEGLRGDPAEEQYVRKIDAYVQRNDITYSFSYNGGNDEEHHDEVTFEAPRNERNEKPFYMEIWHPDERIDLSTLHSAVEHFAKKFLQITPTEIIVDEPDFDESLQSFIKHKELGFFDPHNLPVAFADELVEELSKHWKISSEETLHRLNRSVG